MSERAYRCRVPDAIFAHPRLAPIYDAFDGDRDDLAAYLGIAGELGAERVLDIGCGTGCLAVLLAESGCTVMGADPAGASLAVARAKGGRRVSAQESPGSTAMPRHCRPSMLILR
jgi:2-polyprenyl-3-methyl-5-hydroxy-6-metoxy-1,4-benzoquinol methylase